MIKLPEMECKRCGHKWIARKSEIKVCPLCKNPYWNTERKQSEK